MHSSVNPIFFEYDIASAQKQAVLGGVMEIHTKTNFPDIDQADVLIIGVPEARNSVANEDSKYAPIEIRKALYNLFPGEWHLKIADLGNLKIGKDYHQTYENLKNVLEQLNSKQRVIILGGSQDLTIALTNFYNLHNKAYNVSVFDSVIDGVVFDNEMDNENYLTHILTDKNSHVHNLSIIGIQSYYNHPEKYKIFDKLYVDSFKLSEVQKNLMNVEPEIRDAHIVSLDINVIKYAYMPAQSNARPNGFNGQEICVLSRLAGLSINNRFLGIFEFNPIFDKHNSGAHLTAQIIWYYLEGIHSHKEDYPNIPITELTKFYVSNSVVDLEFYQNKKTGRWWVHVPKMESNSNIYSCSEEDYKKAVNLTISKRIYHIVNKISI